MMSTLSLLCLLLLSIAPASSDDHGGNSDGVIPLSEKENYAVVMDPENPVQSTGYLTGLEVYVHEPGEMVILVFRKKHKSGRKSMFEIVGAKKVISKVASHLKLEMSGPDRLRVQMGDHIGFYFPGKAIIPWECHYEKGETLWGLLPLNRKRMKMSRKKLKLFAIRYVFEFDDELGKLCRENPIKIDIQADPN